ncbi:MAG: hypothetical protein DK306_002132 [Chloroflexi bacterium]|nr:MAG: hypothetical protein DK306_002132 [Chloroflexota bacterium]
MADEQPDPVIDVHDYEGVRVSCTRQRWTDRIEANHPELQQRASEVADAIQNPELVFEDRDYPNRKHHLVRTPDNPYGSLLATIVEYGYDTESGVTIGRIVTAFYKTRIRDDDTPLFISLSHS